MRRTVRVAGRDVRPAVGVCLEGVGGEEWGGVRSGAYRPCSRSRCTSSRWRVSGGGWG